MEIPSGERPKGNCASDANNCSTSVSKLFYICLKARTWKNIWQRPQVQKKKLQAHFAQVMLVKLNYLLLFLLIQAHICICSIYLGQGPCQEEGRYTIPHKRCPHTRCPHKHCTLSGSPIESKLSSGTPPKLPLHLEDLYTKHVKKLWDKGCCISHGCVLGHSVTHLASWSANAVNAVGILALWALILDGVSNLKPIWCFTQIGRGLLQVRVRGGTSSWHCQNVFLSCNYFS